MNSIPADLHYESERESLHLETQIKIEQEMCVTTIVILYSPDHKIELEMYRPAIRELIRQLSHTLGTIS